MQKISIIIVNWNTRELLKRCLTSIAAYPPAVAYEILVVDNASSDGSQQMVREQFSQVRLIESAENLGFGRANNVAIQEAQGEYILLLNSDTEVRAGALDSLVRFLNQNPRTGAVGARLLNPDGNLQFSCSPKPTLLREFLRLFHLPGIRPDGYYPMDEWDLAAPRQVDVLLGACLMLRASVLAQTGLMDDRFFMYSEEVDMCRRVQRAGWELVWLPQAEVVHYGGQSTRQAAAEMFLHLYRSKVLYFRKHDGRLTAQVYKLLLLLASAGRVAAGSLKRSEHLSNNYRRLMAALPGM